MFYRSRSRRLAVRFPFPKNLYLKGSYTQLIVLSISLVDQRLICYDSRSLVLVAHTYPQTVPTHRFQNSIAYVRNLSHQDAARRGDEAWKDAPYIRLSSGWEASSPRPSSNILSRFEKKRCFCGREPTIPARASTELPSSRSLGSVSSGFYTRSGRLCVGVSRAALPC